MHWLLRSHGSDVWAGNNNSKSQLLAGWAKIIHPRLKDLSDEVQRNIKMYHWSGAGLWTKMSVWVSSTLFQVCFGVALFTIATWLTDPTFCKQLKICPKWYFFGCLQNVGPGNNAAIASNANPKHCSQIDILAHKPDQGSKLYFILDVRLKVKSWTDTKGLVARAKILTWTIILFIVLTNFW